MNSIIQNLLPAIMGALLQLLPKEVIQEGLDALFDKIEDRVADTDTAIDDAVVLPIIQRLRAALDIPDNDTVGE